MNLDPIWIYKILNWFYKKCGFEFKIQSKYLILNFVKIQFSFIKKYGFGFKIQFKNLDLDSMTTITSNIYFVFFYFNLSRSLFYIILFIMSVRVVYIYIYTLCFDWIKKKKIKEIFFLISLPFFFSSMFYLNFFLSAKNK